VDDLCDAIKSLAVRGAPALGAAGAMGVALASVSGAPVEASAARLVGTRPTAVNLAWGVERALGAADPVAEALSVAAEDVERNRRIGRHGSALVPEGSRVLTHCNAGSLACVGYGTALGVVRAAHELGRRVHVWVDETRPVLQGSRLTAWELSQLGIPFGIVADSLAPALMRAGEVDVVIVGADRIAANGDVVNKVGTYGLAVAARYHGLPFYVAAPISTVDRSVATGDEVTIEHRDPAEVLTLGDRRVAPPGARAENRAFDVTPALLVTGYVTEQGVSAAVPVSPSP
jgi:methylthioribose-1-phosphate isomerase